MMMDILAWVFGIFTIYFLLGLAGSHLMADWCDEHVSLEEHLMNGLTWGRFVVVAIWQAVRR